MSFTLSEIAAALGLAFHGDGSLVIDGLAEPQDAGPTELALAMDKAYGEAMQSCQARAAMLWPDADWQGMGLEGAILVERAGAVLPGLTRLLDRAPQMADEIHPSAVIDPGAEIGPGARIGAYVVIGGNVKIGANARIAPHVTIDANVRLGANALLHAGVRLNHNVVIGDNFICHANTVIGSDGFSFKKTDQASAVEQMRAAVGTGAAPERPEAPAASAWARVASLGGVVIGDDVEIGASTCVDSGTIRATVIGRGTKIDNQVQIAHNVVVGEDCLICGDTAIAGSVRIGDRVVMGGACKISDNLFIGDDVIVAGTSMVFTNIPAKRQVWGWPAVRLDTQMAINREMRRLPRLARQIREFMQQGDTKDAK